MFAWFQSNRRKTKGPPKSPTFLAPHALLASSVAHSLGIDFHSFAGQAVAVKAFMALHTFRADQGLKTWTFRLQLGNYGEVLSTRVSRQDVEDLGISLAPLKPGTYFATINRSDGSDCLPVYQPPDKQSMEMSDLPPPYVASR
jgi:hypothetical protein